MFDAGQITSFLSSTIRMSTPLLLAGLGLTISERAGLMNIGVEGIMIIGSFTAYAGAKLTGSYVLGLLCAIFFSCLAITIFSVTAITCRARQVIIGSAINMFGVGVTSYLYKKIFYDGKDVIEKATAPTFPVRKIPILSDIPIIGEVLFSHNSIVYIAIIMTVLVWVFMSKTRFGIQIIATGEHPKAADSLGIPVNFTRYMAVLFSGAMIGVAGAYLSIAQSNAFAEDMSAGRGFIALAIVILGKWRPVGVLFGSLLFGATNALQMLIQNSGVEIPRNLIMMLPYIATVIAVIVVSRDKVSAPSALGQPYVKS